MPTVLIAPTPMRFKSGPFRGILEEAGLTPLDVEGADPFNAEELRRYLPGVAAMVAGGEKMTAAMMDLAPGLRVIARTGVGYDAIDVPAATARGVVVTIVPGTNHGSVAEHVFGLLLGVTRRIAYYDKTLRSGSWERGLVRPIRGTTLGLVGLGRIGRAVAERAVAFGMKVIAFDPVHDAAFDARFGIERRELDDLLALADVVSLHLPLTPETHRLFDRRIFAGMKPGALLINTARGGLVNEADLVDALTSGHLGGAGLDVFDPEPPAATNPLFALPNVVVSPHVGGIDTTSMTDMATLAARCIADLYRGRWPAECVVNGGLREGWRW
ncbi:MAG TPA: phosphoglycerate dehydrogenase [Isosphaeraceae bacterium]|jgi:phosphoglycerate dehydrogenase-like enzyme|nr:phosphoglycerate dehydrogenase [Isosphaeraceae bacterium]